MMTESTCKPEHFKGRIVFMSMYNDIVCEERGNKENCIANSVPMLWKEEKKEAKRMERSLLCKEMARDLPSAGKRAANEISESMVVLTELTNADTISQTDVDVQGNLLREYEQRFAELPEYQKLTKPCSDAGFLKNIRNGQFFITHEEEGPDDMQTSCREYTLPRSEETSRVGWTRRNTKIGPVLDVMVCFHQGRYGVEIMIESSFRDRTGSWVRNVNGINNYVTEASVEISIESVEHGCTTG